MGLFAFDWWGSAPEPQKKAPPKLALVEPLTLTGAGMSLIQKAEGYSAVPYICAAGVATIGWGSTIDAAGKPITLDHPKIATDHAQMLFDRDLALFGRGVRRLIKKPINNNQYSALVSLSYNIGLGNLQASTLLRKLNRGDYNGCAGEFWKWRKGGGRILQGLVIRRERERLLFCS